MGLPVQDDLPAAQRDDRGGIAGILGEIGHRRYRLLALVVLEGAEEVGDLPGGGNVAAAAIELEDEEVGLAADGLPDALLDLLPHTGADRARQPNPAGDR